MTERVNLCNYFVYGSVVRGRSDRSLARFLCLFPCSPVVVNLSPLQAFSEFHLLCKDIESSSLLCRRGHIAATFRVGLSYLQTFRAFCGEWCPRCGPLLSLETFACIRHIVYISTICNDLMLFLSIFLSSVVKTSSIWAKFCSGPCFQGLNRIGRTSFEVIRYLAISTVNYFC